MQHNDERPPTSGRPSLLSTEQQAASGGPRILGGFESEPAAGGSALRSKRSYAWLAAGVIAIVAIGAGSAGWLSGEAEKEIVLASSEPLPALAAPGAPLAAELATGAAPAQPATNPEASEVSTAAILQDTPPLASKPAQVPSRAADELTRLLEHPGAAPAVPPLVLERAADQPKAAVAQPAPKTAPKTVASAKPTPAKAVATAKPAPKTVARAAQKPSLHPLAATPSKKKGEVHPKASAGMDSDVTLLAALVAHSKALQPKKASAASEKLKQCKALGSVAEAEQCRARLCAGGAKNEAECKAPRMVRAAAQS